MTMIQRILAAHAGLDKVHAGQMIQVKLDLVLGNDITAPVAIDEFEKIGINKIFDKSKIALVPDHFAPNKNIKSAENCRRVVIIGADSHTCTYGALGALQVRRWRQPLPLRAGFLPRRR